MSKLILKNDKKIFYNGFRSIPLILFMSLFWVIFSQNLGFIGTLIQNFSIVFNFLLIAGALYSFFLLRANKPVAILNENGIWLPDNGFIKWQNIHQFDIYQIPKTPVENIGIRLKNNSLIYAQSNFSGKMRFFWAKIFGYPPIILSNLEIPNSAVISYAKQYVDKN